MKWQQKQFYGLGSARHEEGIKELQVRKVENHCSPDSLRTALYPRDSYSHVKHVEGCTQVDPSLITLHQSPCSGKTERHTSFSRELFHQQIQRCPGIPWENALSFSFFLPSLQSSPVGTLSQTAVWTPIRKGLFLLSAINDSADKFYISQIPIKGLKRI